MLQTTAVASLILAPMVSFQIPEVAEAAPPNMTSQMAPLVLQDMPVRQDVMVAIPTTPRLEESVSKIVPPTAFQEFLMVLRQFQQAEP